MRREIVLLVLLGLCAAGLYFGVRAFANSNRAIKTRDAAWWYSEGGRQLRQNHVDAAVAAFRKASLNEHNRLYTRSLAEALEIDGRDWEARDLLLQERETAPEDPEINVELGRIAAKEHDISDTVRYYHNALYGIWTGPNIDLQRRMIRRELIEFLIAQHARDQALAEILALTAHLPNTIAAKDELGALFLENGDPVHALSNFRAVLRTQPHNQTALEGAGEAAWQLADYAQARRYLWLLVNPSEKEKQMLNTSTLIVHNDPMEQHLTYAKRRRRLLADFDQASHQLRQCQEQKSGSPEAQTFESLGNRQADLKRRLKAARQKDDPELAFQTLEFIYDAEDAISRSCGPLQDLDSALLLIAQKSRGAERGAEQ